jgi:hypothetical protein
VPFYRSSAWGGDGGGDSTGCWIDEERGGAVQRHDYSRARGGQLTVGRGVAAAW